MDTYEKKYKESLELARDYYKANLKLDKADENLILEDIFPELRESEDERVRKEILSLVQYTKGRRIGYEPRIHQDKMITWLEKQEEKHKTEPQSRWRPSKEQMGALAWALSFAKNCGEECAFDLRTLQEQLKNL